MVCAFTGWKVRFLPGRRREELHLRRRRRTGPADAGHFDGSPRPPMERRRALGLRRIGHDPFIQGLSAGHLVGTPGALEGVLGFGRERCGIDRRDPDAGRQLVRLWLYQVVGRPFRGRRAEVIVPLSTGTRLGPYEALSPLGAGGMGEVWRARDTRLAREVAVKVLPGEFAADAGRLKRFEKEARAASALNHPNIVTIYDIGSSDSLSFIAMELVAGKTLRELLFTGPMPVKRLRQIAAQIAEGLAKAHEAGIVHRDLKPENVMV